MSEYPEYKPYGNGIVGVYRKVKNGNWDQVGNTLNGLGAILSLSNDGRVLAVGTLATGLIARHSVQQRSHFDRFQRRLLDFVLDELRSGSR